MAKKSEILREEMRGEWEKIKALHNQVVNVDQREFTKEEEGQIETALEKAREIEVQIQKELKEESLHKSIEDLDGLFTAATEPTKPKRRAPGKGRQSFGEQFVNSQEWREFIAKAAPQGRIPEKAALRGAPTFDAPGVLAKALKKDLLTGSSETSAGALVDVDQTGIYEPLGRYMLTLRDLISVRQTTSDTVEFVRQVTQVTQAAPTQEANVTEYSGASGEISGEKPEGAMTFERVQAIVKTIPVWIPATKRALADAPQLRGLIDDELMSDCEEELEDQLLNGDGIGENFTGLDQTAGTLVQAFSVDIAQTARMAITNLLINGRQIPTAYLYNPQDWESFDLLQDSEGRYYWGGPMAQGPRTLWGVPVAQSFFQTQGTGWLGNWRKMVLWDRETATITVSDSHADFFIRNLVAILCELRAAMGVIRPSAFVEIDLTSGS